MSSPPYDAARDGLDSWALAIRLIALRRGSVRPATPAELYFVEMNGGIP